MTRLDAIGNLLTEAMKERNTKSGLKRIRRCGRALSLSDDEIYAVEYRLGYRNPVTGEPFAIWTDEKPKRKNK